MYDSTVNNTLDARADRRPSDVAGMVRNGLGTILVLAGLGLAIWLAITIYGLIWGEWTPAVVANLTPQSHEDVAIIFPDGEYVLAHKVFPIIGYVLTVFLLMVGVALVKAMVTGGTALLRPSTPAEASVKPVAPPDAETLPQEHYSLSRYSGRGQG